MPQILDVHDVELAVAAITQLNPAPGVLARATSLLQDSGTCVSDVVRLIEMDAALTSDVMRVSNSAAFGFATQATNLQTAIGRLGFDEVLRILAMCVSKNLGSQDLEHYGLSAYGHWSHTVSVAILMGILAERIGEMAHDAYTVGILHSVGKVAIEHMLADMPPVEPCRTADSVDWEHQVLGFDYAQIGGRLLKHWKFSNWICQPVECHLSGSGGSRAWPLMESLRFALDIVAVSGSGFQQKFLVDESQVYMQTYMLSQRELEHILMEAREAFRMHQEALGVYE